MKNREKWRLIIQEAKAHPELYRRGEEGLRKFSLLEMTHSHGNKIIKECVLYFNLSMAATNLRMN
jgi:hypothetical protein